MEQLQFRTNPFARKAIKQSISPLFANTLHNAWDVNRKTPVLARNSAKSFRENICVATLAHRKQISLTAARHVVGTPQQNHRFGVERSYIFM